MKYNLKGFIVANGVTDVFSDWTASVVENLFRFNLIPYKWYKGVKDNNCGGVAFPDQDAEICSDLWQKINPIFSQLNPYDLIRKNYDIEEENGKESADADYGTAILKGVEVTYKRGVY